MAKYRVSVKWHIDVKADSEEEALDIAYEQWDDFDFARDCTITKPMRGE